MRVNQAGRAREGTWRLRFAERWRPRIDPLTGWTGGGDPLAQIELRFPDREAAERAGVSVFMTKPFANADIRAQVRALLGG